jgi:hypothetical protein
MLFLNLAVFFQRCLEFHYLFKESKRLADRRWTKEHPSWAYLNETESLNFIAVKDSAREKTVYPVAFRSETKYLFLAALKFGNLFIYFLFYIPVVLSTSKLIAV